MFALFRQSKDQIDRLNATVTGKANLTRGLKVDAAVGAQSKHV